ncbi:hypothetical protein IMZ48_49130, partial [Candidatus Bathyarchaeota archaeon]|nr:hypothetical protein [Candidatus Bathyarchaeota archaeon]
HVTKFAHLFHDRSANDPGTRHEKLVWELTSILFDDIPQDSEQPESDARKVQLSRFWRDLVADASATSMGLAKSTEEKALASLAGHRVQDACNYLAQGKNYHLGTLVALIDTDGPSKKMMKNQLAEWHSSNFLSEFSPSIRAIYEVLSGNVCVCEGKKGVPVEDRLDSFVISDKFQLNWKQAFGMRLWYGISPKDDLTKAVGLFSSDISQEREPSPPTWFAEEKIQPLWEDPNPDGREDLLWSLLKLYADEGYGLEEVVKAENSQLSPLDFRLCWQLEQALTSTNKASYRPDAAKAADAITFSFAAQLASEGNWLEATFVLLHVTTPKAREQAIRDHLCRHASLLGPETGNNAVTLTQTFKIPTAWIWEAQALYMRSVEKDAPVEVQCLIRAGAYAEAHRRLVEQVAPQAIIERDYQALSDILSKFEGKEDLVADWPRGGEVYQDFLTLMRQLSRREATPTQLLQKLIGGLPALHDNPQTSSTYNTAAVTEMSGIVARAVSDSRDGEQVCFFGRRGRGRGANMMQRTLLPKVMGLPLTEDSHLAHSVNLSMTYYKAVMAR